MNEDLYSKCENKQNGLLDISWNDLAVLNDIPTGKILKDRYYRAKAKKSFKENPNRKININVNTNTDVDENEQNDRLQTLKIGSDGTQSSDKLVWMTEADSKSPTFLLNAHGYDPDLWVLLDAISNMWHSQKSNKKDMLGDEELRLTLMQSKIRVKPKEEKSGFSLSDIDEFFQKFDPNKLSTYSPIRQYKSGGKVLEIALADIHVGNESVTFEELKRRIIDVVNEVKENTKGVSLEKIILCLYGDVLHFDGFNRQTTSGTQMTYSMDYYTAFDYALELYIWLIQELSEITKIKVIDIFGNHDRSSSYGLSKAAESYFKQNENISFDNSHELIKYEKIGITSIAYVHGDMPKKNITNIFMRDGRKIFGETEYSEIHCGHLHHEISQDTNGIIIRYLPSITIPDQWHKLNGYTGAKRGTHCFLYDLDEGLKSIWMIPCKSL